ncbi:MAG: LamG domain-containing protein [Candidatus Nanohalobium sp.]
MELQGPNFSRTLIAASVLAGLLLTVSVAPNNPITGKAFSTRPLEENTDSLQATISDTSTTSTSSLQNGLKAYYRFDKVKASQGYSLEFDGANDFIEINDSKSLDLQGGLTLSAWIYRDSTGYLDIIDKGHSAYWLKTDGPSKISFTVTGGSNNLITSDGIVPAGEWHHVVGVYNGTHKKIYVNGSLIATGSGTSSVTQDNSLLNIGRNPNDGEYFDGEIENARI